MYAMYIMYITHITHITPISSEIYSSSSSFQCSTIYIQPYSSARHKSPCPKAQQQQTTSPKPPHRCRHHPPDQTYVESRTQDSFAVTVPTPLIHERTGTRCRSIRLLNLSICRIQSIHYMSIFMHDGVSMYNLSSTPRTPHRVLHTE